MSDMPVEPEIEADENLHTKEVYARYGLSMYYAQVLEHGVVNFVVIYNLDAKRKSRQRISPDQIDALFDTHFEKTLGQLVHQIKSGMEPPSTLEAELKTALKTRNWLAHDFFREKAEDFMSFDGKKRMIDAVDDARQLFRRTDKLLFEATRPMREAVGMTDEAIAKEYEVMFSEIKQKAGEA